MSLKVTTAVYLVVFSTLTFCFPAIASDSPSSSHSEQSTKSPTRVPFEKTLFIHCDKASQRRSVLSNISRSEDATWQAYVEVSVQDGSECLQTTRLWIGHGNRPYRLVYLLPPTREHSGNGMEILGWARKSSLLLVRTELWQQASDAPTRQQVLAINAATGMVYEPRLEEMLGERKDKQCTFRVIGAGVGSGPNLIMLVRAKFFTFLDEGDSEADIPPAKRCDTTEETWSFNYANGAITQVKDADLAARFKKFLFPADGRTK